MAESSLDPEDLRAIERSLDAGATSEAAARSRRGSDADSQAAATEPPDPAVLPTEPPDASVTPTEPPRADDHLERPDTLAPLTEPSSSLRLSDVAPLLSELAPADDDVRDTERPTLTEGAVDLGRRALVPPPALPREASTSPPAPREPTPAPASAPTVPRMPSARALSALAEGKSSRPPIDDASFPRLDHVDDDLTPPQSPRVSRARASQPSPTQQPSLESPPKAAADAREGGATSTTPPRHDERAPDSSASTTPPRPVDVVAAGKNAGTPATPPPRSFDRLRSKSLLPERAGRYSAQPDRPSSPGARRSAPPAPARRPAMSRAPVATEERPASEPALRRSRRPRPERAAGAVDRLRWHFENDEGALVLETIESAPSALERDLLHAYVHARQGRAEQARALLPEPSILRGLPPDYRALVVLTLLELRDVPRAAEEARRALDTAPDSALVKLAFVCSAVRAARHREDDGALTRAASLLPSIDPALVPEPGLLDALHAALEAQGGSPQVALQLAQRALRADADNVDALVALVEAASQVGDHPKARVALDTLVQRSPSTAELVKAHLSGRGMGPGSASSASVWLPLENELVGGGRDSALRGLEGQAAKLFKRDKNDDFVTLASQASRFFAAAPVFRHFCPFDMSLSSLERLEVGLSLVYGLGPRAAPEKHDLLPLLLAAYLGETLRQCCQGRWVGDARQPSAAHVSLAWEDVSPFRVIENRLRHGERAPLRSALARTLELATPSAYRYRMTAPLAPELPWGDGQWPTPEALPRIGRALSHSVVALYTSEACRVHLDRSLQSLHGIDRYLALVTTHRPLDKGGRWLRWLSVLIGCYLGEVLCKAYDAQWALREVPAPDAIVVELGQRPIAPIAFVMETLQSSEPVSLRSWAAELET